jgi:hypothetical protein
MFFGLMNSPAMFQAMMDDYFKDLLNEGGIVIYMDDILISAYRSGHDDHKMTIT